MERLTTKQVAEILGVNTSRVRQLIGAGRLRGEKFGNIWMFKPRDLNAVAVRKHGRPRKGTGDDRG